MEQRRCFGCMGLTDQPVCPRCGWGAQRNNEFHQLPVGTVLADKYLVGRALGQGGFGITYIGWDRNLDIRVCIKEFFPMSTVNRDHSIANTVNCNATVLMNGYASSRERFLREAKSMAKFRDVPQIVSIFDFFQANNTAYMVMQYIEGIDLAKYVHKRGGRIAMDETLRILKPIMEALSLVHEAGMIHRDIAPDNIMLHPRDGSKLLDFGAVRQVNDPNADRELTHATEAILKSGFAPMEQYSSRGSLGPWTDVYALSATIYYCVTGRIPPDAVTRSTEDDALDWSGAEGITPEQIRVLEHGMAVRAKNRIQSVKELMEGLYAPAKPEPQTVPGKNTAKTDTAADSKVAPLQSQPQPKPSPQRGTEPKHDPPLNPPRIPQPQRKRIGRAAQICVALAVVIALALAFLPKRGWYFESGKYSYYVWPGVRLSDSWLQDQSSYYYLDSDGTMHTGWLRNNGALYYLAEDGKMVTGSHDINGKRYVFAADGKLIP